MGLTHVYIFRVEKKKCNVTQLQIHMYVKLVLIIYFRNFCLCEFCNKDVNNILRSNNVLMIYDKKYLSIK